MAVKMKDKYGIWMICTIKTIPRNRNFDMKIHGLVESTERGAKLWAIDRLGKTVASSCKYTFMPLVEYYHDDQPVGATVVGAGGVAPQANSSKICPGSGRGYPRGRRGTRTHCPVCNRMILINGTGALRRH